jgi:hypothetical protein
VIIDDLNVKLQEETVLFDAKKAEIEQQQQQIQQQAEQNRENREVDTSKCCRCELVFDEITSAQAYICKGCPNWCCKDCVIDRFGEDGLEDEFYCEDCV